MGLPLHPLVVHAVVVLVPLSALGGLVIAAMTSARKRYGSVVALGSLAAAASTFVAQQAGEQLYAGLRQHTAALERHAQIGGDLLVWVIILAVGTVAQMVGQWLLDHDRPRGRLVWLIGAAVTVIGAVVSLVQVVRIGHAGSTAVWGGS